MTANRRRVTLGAAAVFTALAWTYNLWPASKPPARIAAAPAPQTPPPAAGTASVQPAPPLSRAELESWAALYRVVQRDPFFTAAEIAPRNRPPVVVESRPVLPVAAPLPPALPAYTLKMIITAGPDRFASIGERVVKVGDMLGDERVAQILPDAVVLDRGGQRRRLELSTSDSSGLVHIERVR